MLSFLQTNLVYFLALQKCNKQSDWTIHGLWVDYKDGGFPQFCHKTKFNVDILTDIRDELDKKWPSCPGYGKNEGLWKHEFAKHASCFEHDLSELSYFNTTLQLYNLIDVDSLCKTKNRGCLISIKHSDIHNNLDL